MLGGWLAEAAPLRGEEMVCYHKNWAYFEERFGVTCAARPGIPPTPGHMFDLIELMRGRGMDVVLAASYFDHDKVETVAARGGAAPLVVPLYPDEKGFPADYVELVDTWITGLSVAFERGRPGGW